MTHNKHRRIHHKTQFRQVLAHIVPSGNAPDDDGVPLLCKNKRHHILFPFLYN